MLVPLQAARGSGPGSYSRAKLTASDGQANDSFGNALSVSADGTTTVVGAFYAALASPLDGRGAVYVYTRPAGAWSSATEQAKLTASDAADGDNFGTSVAISADGSTIAVGAPSAGGASPGDAQGAVYVFQRPPGGWSGALTQTAKLTASDGVHDDRLGTSVAVSADGSTVASGAYQASVNALNDGAAYVFERPGGGWANGTQAAKLTASTSLTDDGVGRSIAISGDGSVVFASAPSTTVNAVGWAGAVYVFERGSGGWSDTPQTATLTSSSPQLTDYLGMSLAVTPDASTLAVGASISIGSNNYQGGVFVFARPAGGWTDTHQQAILTASDGAAGDGLGDSAAISDDGTTIVSGAQNATVSGHAGQGVVYRFDKRTTAWANGTEAAKLTTGDGGDNDELGTAVALAGDLVIGGAPDATIGSNSAQGEVYAYVLPTATAVACAPQSVAAGEQTTCTATVTDAAPGTHGSTASVAFTSDGAGAFAAPSCQLTPIAAGVASCQVAYAPAAAGTQTVTGSFGGDPGHEASQAAAAVTVTAAPAPATTSGGGSTPAPLTKPLLTLSAPKTERVLRQRGVVFSVKSDEAAHLVARVTLAFPRPAKRIGLKRVARELQAGAAVKIKVKLSRAARTAVRRALARHKKVTVTVKAVATNAAGSSTKTRRIAVR